MPLDQSSINLILIIALVGITAYYAYDTHKLAKNAEIERNRPVVGEIIRDVIYPLHERIETNKKDLKVGYYGLHLNVREGKLKLGFPSNSALELPKSGLFDEILMAAGVNEIKEELPSIQKKVENYNKCGKELWELLNAYSEKLMNSKDFTNELGAKITNYTNLTHKTLRKEVLLELIINNTEPNHGKYADYMKFLKEQGKGIMEKAQQIGKEELPKIEQQRNKCLNILKKMEPEVNQLLIKLKEKYGIPEEEFHQKGMRVVRHYSD